MTLLPFGKPPPLPSSQSLITVIMPEPISEPFPQLGYYPSLLKLLELWNELRGEQAMMSLRDLDAIKFFPWLGSLHLIESTGNGQYLYRIFGGKIGVLFGRDLHNRAVGDLPEPERSEALSDYDTVLNSKIPFFIERQRNIINRYDIALRPTTFGKLCLPLSDDGVRMSHILASIYPRTA